MVLALVVLADLFLIVLFTLSMQLVRWTMRRPMPPGDVSLLARISWEIFGSLAFGAAFGAIFAFYLRKVGREVDDRAARAVRRCSASWDRCSTSSRCSRRSPPGWWSRTSRRRRATR